MVNYVIDKLRIYLKKVNQNDIEKLNEDVMLSNSNTGNLFDMSVYNDGSYVVQIKHTRNEIAAYNLLHSNTKGNVIIIGRLHINTYLQVFLDVDKSILYKNKINFVFKILEQNSFTAHLSRLDLAMDKEHSYNPITRLFNAITNHNYYTLVNGKEYTKQASLITTPLKDKTIHQSIYLPSINEVSPVKLFLYKKYDEQLLNQCPIIAEYLSNFNNPNKVYRFELRFSNISKFSPLNKLDISKLSDNNYLQDVFKMYIVGVIDVRLRDKYYLTKKSRSKKITIFNF